MRIRAICLLAALAPAALAPAAPALAADPPLVSLGAGGTDILNQQARSAGDFRMEYRSGYSLVPYFENYVKVKPWAGVEITTRTSVWGGGGILLDIPVYGHFVLSPSVGVGAYERGRGKNLGSGFEIRSQMEGGYVFDDQSRLVASFGHTSNAGFTKRNPGTEAAVISYQIPLTYSAR